MIGDVEIGGLDFIIFQCFVEWFKMNELLYIRLLLDFI